MKRFVGKTIGIVCLLTGWLQASDLGNTLRAFEDKPGYAQPIATLIGTINSQGWASSAQVGDHFGWNFALLLSIAYIGEDDHSYDFTHQTGCAELREAGYNCVAEYDEETIQDAPTIWGGDQSVHYYEYRAIGDGPSDFQSTLAGSLDKGYPDVREHTTIPFPLLSLSFSGKHFRGTVRGIGVPSFSEFGGLYLMGMGAQYDFSSFIPYLNPHGIYSSVTANFSFWGLSYRPDSDIQGKLSLDGWTSFSGLVLGYRWKFLECFTELGYETSTLNSGGTLEDTSIEEGDADRIIRPAIEVDGRNGLRASINIAFHLGKWQPVIGQSFGAQIGTQANLIQFGKEGSK